VKCFGALPIPAEIDARLFSMTIATNPIDLQPVRAFSLILARSHLFREADQARARYMVMMLAS
jgi:hypothetical protein